MATSNTSPKSFDKRFQVFVYDGATNDGDDWVFQLHSDDERLEDIHFDLCVDGPIDDFGVFEAMLMEAGESTRDEEDDGIPDELIDELI